MPGPERTENNEENPFPRGSGAEDYWERYEKWLRVERPDLSEEQIKLHILLNILEDEMNEPTVEQAGKAWAEFFTGELGPEDEKWIERELPEVAEHRRTMNAQEFTEWFLDWRKERRRKSSL